MDLQLPGISGIDAIHAIRRDNPDSRIIVLTVYQETKTSILPCRQVLRPTC